MKRRYFAKKVYKVRQCGHTCSATNNEKEDVRMKEKKRARACGAEGQNQNKSNAQDCQGGKDACGGDASCHDDDCGC
jgi:hypothetical protein